MKRHALVVCAALLAIFLVSRPAKANAIQLHIFNASVQMGWAVGELRFRGDSPRVANALRVAAQHITAAEALMAEPFRSARAKKRFAPGLVTRLTAYTKRTARRNANYKQTYIRDVFGTFKAALGVTYDSRRPRISFYKARSTCDLHIANAGYHFANAHIAAGVKTAKARSIQNMENSNLRTAVRGGLAVALDGTNRTKTTARKLCCSFGTPAQWGVVSKLSSNTPFQTYSKLLYKLQGIVEHAGGKHSKGCAGERTCSYNGPHGHKTPPRTTKTSGADGALGCFKEGRKIDHNGTRGRDLAGAFLKDAKTMRPFKCRMFCWKKGFKYAAVQYGAWCFCGNSYGRFGKEVESKCSRPCPGDRTKRCGGAYANLVFRAGQNR